MLIFIVREQWDIRLNSEALSFNSSVLKERWSYIIKQERDPPGRSKGRGRGAMTSPNRRLGGFFYEKNWLCWDVEPALFSKVTLFCLSEVFCDVGLKDAKNMDPVARARAVFRATSRKGRHFLEKSANSHLLCPLPPMKKTWLRTCDPRFNSCWGIRSGSLSCLVDGTDSDLVRRTFFDVTQRECPRLHFVTLHHPLSSTVLSHLSVIK